ncbi:hypothetical protein [Erythrobacter sp. SD-21]|uniref:hypothetical protein n=1 Tax=Erythrobacter sp. SD-21 TaxID=161528 RepID=UPI000153FC21|nr:hypothetical protein [Erythrobacter sp. SD-21]EDL49719.1 uncharacterized conserved protein-like protein [Erythrobacter sp. SD-21]
MSSLEAEFDQAMMDVYRRAKDEAGYNATVFLQMLMKKRGIETAKTLINSSAASDGYTALYMRGRLDLTVEALVIEDERWHSLFTTEELTRARKRLKDYRYEPGH